jgi:hypothetical protein
MRSSRPPVATVQEAVAGAPKAKRRPALPKPGTVRLSSRPRARGAFFGGMDGLE